MKPWAVRDVKHGKTFFFESFEDMVQWIEKIQKQIALATKK